MGPPGESGLSIASGARIANPEMVWGAARAVGEAIEAALGAAPASPAAEPAGSGFERAREWRAVRARDPGLPAPRVAHRFDLRPEALPALFGIRASGCVACPVHPDWEPDRLARVLDAIGVTALVSADDAGISWPARPIDVPGFSSLRLYVREVSEDQVPPAPAGTEVMLATSGSTGRPRIVCHGWDTLRANARAANERNGFGAGDTWHATLAWAHVGGLAVAVRAETAGGTVSFGARRFDPDAIAAALARDGVTHISVVPAMLDRLLEAGVPPAGVRCLLVGGAAAPARLLKRARRAGWPVVPTYGLTEAGAQVATAIVPAATPASPAETGGAAAGTGGSSGANGGAEAGAGEGLPLLDGFDARTTTDGEILLRGPAVMLGTLSEEDPFEPGGWLATGDLGEVDATVSPRTLSIRGRATDRIITGGANVDPVEVEEVLREHPGVRETCVVGAPDPVWGELVTAFVATGSGDPIGNLDAWARERLAGPRLPRRWRFIGELPRLASGKVDRARLGALAADEAQASPERR